MKIKWNDSPVYPVYFSNVKDPSIVHTCKKKNRTACCFLNTVAKNDMTFLGSEVQPSNQPWLRSQGLGSVDAKGSTLCPRSHNKLRLSQRQWGYTT